MGFTQRPAWHDYTSPDLGQKRDEAVERKSATKRHLIQDGRSDSHATLTPELSHYRMSKIISSVHPWMIDKADSEGPWPITNLYLGHMITTNQSDESLTVQSPNRSTRGSFLLLLSELWRCHWVFLQQTHHAFARVIQQQQLQSFNSSATLYFISLCSLPGRPG